MPNYSREKNLSDSGDQLKPQILRPLVWECETEMLPRLSFVPCLTVYSG
jgi:hypothetical protein